MDAGKNDAIDDDVQSTCEGEEFELEKTLEVFLWSVSIYHSADSLQRVVEPMRNGCENQVDPSPNDGDQTLAASSTRYDLFFDFQVGHEDDGVRDVPRL